MPPSSALNWIGKRLPNPCPGRFWNGSHRKHARADKNWVASDRLRDEIQALGYVVQDGKAGIQVIKNQCFRSGNGQYQPLYGLKDLEESKLNEH